MLPRMILPLAMAFSFPGFAAAASVEVIWNDPASYSDIAKASSDTKQSFDRRISSQLEEHLAKLARELPDDQKLIITFKNIKLAGNVDAVRGTDTVRVVQGNRYPAQLEFDYILSDAAGEVLKQGSENLKSTGATIRTASPGAFGIEKKLLTNWFKKTLK